MSLQSAYLCDTRCAWSSLCCSTPKSDAVMLIAHISMMIIAMGRANLFFLLARYRFILLTTYYAPADTMSISIIGMIIANDYYMMNKQSDNIPCSLRMPLFMICVMMLLSACDAMERDVVRIAGKAHHHYDETRYRLSRLLYSQEKMEEETTTIAPQPASFCYKLMMDIVCYSKPHPELHMNLVAVQGQHAYGYDDFLPEYVLKERYHTAPQPAHEVSIVDTMG
ncbi:MAG: hypothetical protein F6K62_10060, partial [Sphaerospermopsis sp. SIO1G2]|nr:hypothetical protein [Sphaerospermopsis sp. SIO1G2]